MKSLKTLGLAFVVVSAAIACFGPGSASATVLCKTATNPCSADYPSGTEIHIRQTKTVVIENPEGTTTYEECPLQTTLGKTANTGGATETVEIKIETLTWTNCRHTIHTLVPGALEIHYTSSGNGTVTSKNTEWKWWLGEIFGEPIVCWYTTGTGTDIGTLKGGEKAILEVNVVLKKKEGSPFGCWEETRWTGTYEITTPTPLYVEGS